MISLLESRHGEVGGQSSSLLHAVTPDWIADKRHLEADTEACT